jgi:acetyltransferase-like isoleucine patch superfamily enzyme
MFKLFLDSVLKFFRVDKVFVYMLMRANAQFYFNLKPNGENPLLIKGGKYQQENQIPRTVYFNTRSGNITVGKNTVFGENVMVLTGKHATIFDVDNLSDLHQVPDKGRDIIIGNNCYIGSGAIIIGPLEISDYSVIGAGSVVTKDVPEKSFFAGNPAKLIRKL